MPLAMPITPRPNVTTRLFRLSPDKRVAPRVAVAVEGRIMLEDRSEHEAVTIDASLRALAVQTSASGEPGARVVGYFETLGRLEGTIERANPGNLVIELSTTLIKRERLAAQLIWLANRNILNLADDRRHERIVPKDPRVRIRRLRDEQAIPMNGNLFDVSHSGAGVSVLGRFRPGEEILLGDTAAKVVRVFDRGIAVEFRAPIPDRLFNPEIRL